LFYSTGQEAIAMAEQGSPILKAISTRRSVRAFLPDAVAPELIRSMLETAARAPSGNNIQPWQVHVVSGPARDRLAAALMAAFDAVAPWQTDYQYYPGVWREPYLDRRRENGWSLYGLLGIKKGDRVGSRLQHRRNFAFFGSPVVIYIVMDEDMGQGS